MFEMSEATEKFPWKDGYWQPNSNWVRERFLFVKGSDVFDRHIAEVVQDCPLPAQTVSGKWSFGKFGDASEKLEKRTGISECNMRLAIGACENGGRTVVLRGIVAKCGTKAYFQLDQGKIGKLQWVDEVDMKKILGPVEHMNARSHPYKIQPENQGKLIFLSGAPVGGKNMSAVKLAQKEGFVYYNAD